RGSSASPTPSRGPSTSPPWADGAPTSQAHVQRTRERRSPPGDASVRVLRLSLPRHLADHLGDGLVRGPAGQVRLSHHADTTPRVVRHDDPAELLLLEQVEEL